MLAFQLGAAFKPSLLGEDRLSRLHFYAKTMARLGYRYLVVDSETEKADLSTTEFAKLVEFCQDLGFPEPVLTIPVRRSDAWTRLYEACEVLTTNGFGGVCLVAGNPAYLSTEELKTRASKLLVEAAEKFRTRCRFSLLMVGTEHAIKPAMEVSERFRAIPFMLLTPQTAYEATRYNNGLPKALYAPFYVGEPVPDHVYQKIKSYLKRRNSQVKPEEVMTSYVLLGSGESFAAKIRAVVGNSIDVFVGFPMDDKPGQLAALKTAATQPTASP
ncbi:MAG: hypothetical protein RMI49_04130 [Candidatus Caldarchaeum sp.]|nr:hypothetical protein [Candidatus Caldarchaeum sp.]